MRFQQGPPCTIPEVVKELALGKVLTLPDVKPSVEGVLDFCFEISIGKTTLIDTRLVENGFPVKKAVVAGEAEVTVKYEAAVIDQQVHAAIFNIPFETLVEWPGGPPSGSPICVNVTLEHSQVELLSDRDFYGVLVIRIDFYRR